MKRLSGSPLKVLVPTILPDPLQNLPTKSRPAKTTPDDNGTASDVLVADHSLTA